MLTKEIRNQLGLGKGATCGIYALVNNSNGKLYVGSAKDIACRVKGHLQYLEEGRHCNSHLQSSYNNGDRFTPSVLEICIEAELVDREQYYIDFYVSSDRRNGYNKMCAIRTYISDEVRKKQSLSRKGKTLEELMGPENAEKHRQRMREQVGEKNPNFGNRGPLHPNYGKTAVEIMGEEKAKAVAANTSAVHKGKSKSEEHKRKLSAYRKGRKMSEETRTKIGQGVNKHFSECGRKSFEETYGDKAEEERARRSKVSKEKSHIDGKTWEEAYGKEHADKMKKATSERRSKPKVHAICINCGGEFPKGSRRTRQYCAKKECVSVSRSKAGKTLGDKVRKPLNICLNCGKQVPTRNRKYCDEYDCQVVAKGSHNIGRPHSEENLRKLKQPRSDETKARMSAAAKKRYGFHEDKDDSSFKLPD